MTETVKTDEIVKEDADETTAFNKAKIIEHVSKHCGISKIAAETAVTEVFKSILDNLVTPGDKVSIAGFGMFTKDVRAARDGRNPQTNEPMRIPEAGCMKFRPAKKIKDAMKAL